jgi:hypothetical protein
MQNYKKPEVKIVKRFPRTESNVFYVLISDVNNSDNSYIIKIFPHYNVAKYSRYQKVDFNVS